MNSTPMVQASRSWARWVLVVLCAAFLGAACLAALACNHDGGHDSIIALPTVPIPCEPPAPDPRVICYDLRGRRPPREVQRRRAENRPDFCFIRGTCFYNCDGR